MSGKNWTPGPWAVGAKGIHQRGNTRSNQIANTPSVKSENAPDYQYNAYLISAAPELYEALEKASGYMNYLAAMDTTGKAKEVMEEIHAVLAKARGESDDLAEEEQRRMQDQVER